MVCRGRSICRIGLLVCVALGACNEDTTGGTQDSAVADAAGKETGVHPDAVAPDSAAPKPDSAAPDSAAPKPDSAAPDSAAPKPDSPAVSPDGPSVSPDAPVGLFDLGGVTCAQLNTQYKAEVAKAKKCSGISPTAPCKVKGQTELGCPCTAYLDASNTAPLATIKTLEAAWKAKSCSSGWPCPKVPCPPVSGAKCVSGSCVDY